MKKFELESEEAFIEFAIDRFNTEEDISLIISTDNIEEILESRTFECKSLEKEINSDNYTYVINKYTVKSGIYLEIQPITFDEDGEMITEVENELVVVQEGLLDEDDLLCIEADEIIVIDYNEEYPKNEFDNDCLGKCEICTGCEEELTDVETIDEFLEDKIQEFTDLLDESVDDESFCFHCNLKELLEQIFVFGYEKGKKELASSLGELLTEIVEE